MLLALAVPPAPAFEFGPVNNNTALVTDAAASGGKAVAIRVADKGSGGAAWELPADARLQPGRYRCDLSLRLLLPPAFDHTRLHLSLILRSGEEPFREIPVVWTLLNSRPGVFTTVSREFTISAPVQPTAAFQWRIAALPLWMKDRPALATVAPTVDEAAGLSVDAADTKADTAADNLEALMQAETAVPVAEVNYPAVVLDSLTFSPLTTTLAVAKVWPEKVHIYPGEPNPVTVTVRSFSNRPQRATVRLTLLAGLEDAEPPQEAQLEVPANGTAEQTFNWKANTREFGYEARAELLTDGKTVDSASDYFSVSLPVWKTAIQGGGFITWYGREKDFEPHVEGNRRGYINVEEAFSWQPSSWTDLNPTTETWWTGQNNFHNSMRGLKDWMNRSHAHGIKMITYIWATASGPAGLEWARQYPDLVTHEQVGLSSEFHDVEDLRLYDVTHTKPSLWRYQYGVWHAMGINRGLLRTMQMGADQVIASAKRFGWDGIRYDSRPTWSAMGAQGVHAEFQQMGVTALMGKLIPEYMAKTDGNWDSTAISVRNVRYLAHRFRTEIGPQFAISSNYDFLDDKGGEVGLDYLRAYCAGGSQINQEAFRHMTAWPDFYGGILKQVEYARQNGGYQAVQLIDEAAGSAEASTYLSIFIFAGGSHPYCYGEFKPSPGAYARFATRYGEFLWDPALVPLKPPDAGLTVESTGKLLWEPFVRRRTLADGKLRTVMQLITPPPQDEVVPKQPRPLRPWLTDVTVDMNTQREPVVWLLSAEPELRAQKLAVSKSATGARVRLPEHRLWSVLVWTE